MTVKGGKMLFTSTWKMLALFLLIIAMADFCQSKAFSEAEKTRGKRFYNHESVGPYQTYDSQGNAEHWMKGKFYQPEVDGQPIYVPAIDQPGSYNEFLDAYYKSYTPAWNLVTAPPSTYNIKSMYESPEEMAEKYAYDEKDGVKYSSPVPNESKFTVDGEISEDFNIPELDYDPEIGEETIVTEIDNKNSDMVTSEDYDIFDYDDLESDEFESKNLDGVTLESTDLVELVDPVSSESLKKADLPQKKPGSSEYAEPVIVKTVKQKSKPNGVKGDSHKNPSTPKSNSQSQYDYEKPVIKNTVKQKPKTVNKDSPKASVSKPQVENEDYAKPAVIKTTKQKPNMERKTDKKPTIQNTKPQIETVDDYEKPVIIKTVKQKPMTVNKDSPKGSVSKPQVENEDYAKPVVIKTTKHKPNMEKNSDKKQTIQNTKPQLETVDDYENAVVTKNVKQKPKANIGKEDSYKPSMSKTKPELESEDYEKPVVIKTTVKPNKVTKPSRYGDGTRKTPHGKSKGKRRKQYLKPNKPRTGSETTDLDPETTDIAELSKNLQSYHSSTIQIKTTLKPHLKNKPVETKEKIDKTDQYKPLKTTPLKSNSKDKPVKTKEMVTVQSYPNDNSIKEKATEKYDEHEEKETLTRQLNEDLIESDVSNTEKSLNKPDTAEGLNVPKNEFPESKLVNSEQTTLENTKDLETSKNSAVTESETVSASPNDFRGLSSINSNIWSLLFNPNAEQNRLKQKRCITRSNETGFCTYIQNCEVPQIATSLEQLLNNACVIDEIFIGVCCPEFPVQTVKVHWDQTSIDFDNQIEDEFGQSTQDCGIRSNEATEAKSWPWKAPLVSMSNGKIFCGAVVVSEDHVLTAAHCTTKIPKNQILVRLGQYDDTSGDDYAVVEIKRHAKYNPKTMQNDIALLKLGRRIMNDAHIGVVCLPDEDDENDHDGETATLLGWRGIFGTKSRDPEFLEVIPNRECASKLGMKVPSTTLCTETRKENERTCNADSGAPLVIEENGKYEVIGILSWNRNDCDRRFPSTFSRVSSYTGWIKNHIA